MYNTRQLTEKDYLELLDWWKWFRFPPPAQEMLPDNGTFGLMISKDGINICAGFIYLTNSKIAWIEFIVSNPEYKNKDRKEAIVLLIEQLTEVIKRNGFTAVFSSLKDPNLLHSFEKAGFSKGSNNTTEMIKKI